MSTLDSFKLTSSLQFSEISKSNRFDTFLQKYCNKKKKKTLRFNLDIWDFKKNSSFILGN